MSSLFRDLHSPRLRELVRSSPVRALVAQAAAAFAHEPLVDEPLVADPVAPVAAQPVEQRSYGISTPMGRTSRFTLPY